MKKADLIIAFLTGAILGWYLSFLLKSQGVTNRLFSQIIPILFPFLAALGLWIAGLLGKRFLVIFQLAKFCLIGALATLLDLGVLNFLMWIFGVAVGWPYSVFKGISFVVATTCKYLVNKFWVFEKSGMGGAGKEFGHFFLVTLVGLAINVGVATFMVNVIGPQFGTTEKVWANIGAIAAAFSSVTWNFLSYKFIVFKK